MGIKTYRFAPDQPPRLAILYTLFYRSSRVTLDGATVGTFESAAALRTGRSFTLGDGSVVFVRLKAGLLGQFEVSWNGVPLVGSDGDHPTHFRTGQNVTIAVGVLSLVMAAASFLAGPDFMNLGENTWVGLGLIGLVYVGLGVVARVMRSGWPLVPAALLLALDVVALLAQGSIGGVLLRSLFCYAVARGFFAWRRLTRAETAARATN
jgi:hypothetical protein